MQMTWSRVSRVPRKQSTPTNKFIKSKKSINSGKDSIPLRWDNQGFIFLAYNPVFHARTKHIDIQQHYIWNKVAERRIELIYVLADKMVADSLTKPFTHVKFYGFFEQMQMTWSRVSRVPRKQSTPTNKFIKSKKSINSFKSAIKIESVFTSEFGVCFMRHSLWEVLEYNPSRFLLVYNPLTWWPH